MKKIKTKEKKKKTLRSMIILVVILNISCIAIVTGAMSAYFSYTSTLDCLKKSMSSTALVAAETVENRIGKFTTLAQSIANDNAFYDDTSTDEEKLTYLSSKFQNNNDIVGFNYYTSNGISISDGMDCSSYELFQRAIKGETYVSSPDTDEATGECVINISVPVWKDGADKSSVTGVISFLVKQENLLNTIVEKINLSNKGDTYIIDKNGYTIADTNVELVKGKENILEEAKTDSNLKQLADIYSKAIAGEAGFRRYPYEGVAEFVAYAPIKGTDSWSICVEAPVSDFTLGVTKSIYASIIIIIIAIFLSVIVTVKLAKTFSVPLTAIMNRLKSFAEGDVTSPVPELKTTVYELDSLKASFINTTEYTHEVITDIDSLLTEMSQGNFAVDSEASEKYIGDYEHILAAFERLKKGLNESFMDILRVSELVSEGSSTVSAGAQALAQGSTEQASSIQELSASILDISQRVRENAEHSAKAKKLAENAEQIMQNSVEDMHFASQAMDEISTTSKDISKVIKAIDDIAFQTNILALNAAVEAARAGAAGKGFAVVADEVRNLSQKSAEAAKSSAVLIESSIAAVEKGSQLVSKTNEGFNQVAALSAEVKQIVEEISVQAQEQSAAISQVSNGIEQVSSVVQMNSATSEESAAASEELSGQAESLKSLVSRFKLNDCSQL